MVTRLLIFLCVFAPLEIGAQTVVAGYRDDFIESGAPAPGWNYLWNAPEGWAVGTTGDQASGFIGSPVGYRVLSLVDGTYTADGDTTGGNNPPSGFLRLTSTGGHPGLHNNGTNKRDRYAIAAFTVPANGHYAIANSYLTIANASSDGVEVLVFPGKSEAILRVIADPSSANPFDTDIGHLDAGQTIYVAFGPNEEAAFDGFQMDFEIVRTERLSFKDQFLNGIASGEDVITITPGRYYVTTLGRYLTVNDFNPSTHVTIVADGVELISQTDDGVLRFGNCSNFTLRGLSIDYDPHLYRQGTVESISSNTFHLRLHEGYPTDLSPEATSGITYVSSNLWMKQMTNTIYPNNITELEPGLYAVSAGFSNMAVGDYVSLTNPHGNPHTILMDDMTGIRLEDVEIHGAPAFALLSRNGYQIDLENVQVTPGPTPLRASVPRLLSSNADGLHFKHSHGEIQINNCHTAYTGDDGIILTNSYAPIFEKSQGNAITVATKSRQDTLEVGDQLFLYNPLTGTREEATVQSVTQVSMSEEAIRAELDALFPNIRMTNSTFEQAFLLTLDRSVTAPVSGWIANRSGESSNFLISNCLIDNTRARGILIKASNGIVRGNEVFNSFLPGIQLRPEAEIWMEGDFAQNVLIEDNELRRCSLARNNGYAPIYVSAEGSPAWIPGSGHVNISIIHNRIYNAPSASILVKYADDVLIRSNRFTTSHNFTAASPWYASVIRLEYVNNVSILGNNLVVGINKDTANISALIGTGPQVTGLDVVTELLLDDDKDLLPDVWEIEYFGDPALTDANDDFDGDGLTLVQEFIASLNPLVPDAFTARLESPDSVSWAPKDNRFITIHSTESLDTPFTVFARDIPAEAGQYSLPMVQPGSSVFYQLEITD